MITVAQEKHHNSVVITQTFLANMRILVLFLLYSCLLRFSSAARNTLKAGQNITHGDESTNLVSDGGNFELGFFDFSSGSSRTYLGIWYHRLKAKAEGGMEQRTFVWVANRDKPIGDSRGVFQIGEDGNLQVLGTDGKTYWSSPVDKRTSVTNGSVMLMDTGNLVLKNETGETVWQSFKHPTDTFVPGMKMDRNLELTSWRSSDDPASGTFTFKMAETGDNGYNIWENPDKLHWESGTPNSGALPPRILYMLINFTLTPSTYRIFKSSNESILLKTHQVDYQNRRIAMSFKGQIQLLDWDNSTSNWTIITKEPANTCKRYNFCGNFSSCSIENKFRCKCLPGFIPRSPENWDTQNFSDGCTRKSKSCDRQDIKFLTLRKMKARKPDEEVIAETDEECKTKCQSSKACTQCQGYSYNASSRGDRANSSTCLIWKNDLLTLEENADDGVDLSVPVKMSDIVLTARTCDPCGTNIIPYPLSTGPDCGDPMYLRFNCSYDNGQLYVSMLGDNYRVTWMEPTSRKFYVQFPNLGCDTHHQGEPRDSPFTVTDWCLGDETIEVSWKPPLEPVCNDYADCEGWPHSTCNATKKGESRCLCDSKFHWDVSNLTCTQAYSGHHKRVSLTLVLILVIIVFMASTAVFAYAWKRKGVRNQDIGSMQRIRTYLHDSERQVKDLMRLWGSEEEDNEGIDVPYFDFESILAATDNFSDAHKLGQGGYGPVYKGKFPGGQDIAVKRLSSVSSQGLQEFKNEVVLIAKLQHRNLVRLRGYCITGDEKILLYEYMPNKSLDSIIFDRTQRILLGWKMRFDIMIGVARGLLYLHQDSRLRVIHRDLKTSNILLDEEMKPKISDFGLARIFGGKETEANTERVVGTYGYISPEYALDGFFSIKSDVFSFGVVLLEIISAKKNTGFYKSRQASSLLGYAWTLWADNKLMDLMDPSLSETCDANQFIRCAIIGLLCVQDEPSDRPTMSNVVTMLDSEAITLPIPKQPTFFMSKGLSSTGSSSSKPETSLQIDSSYQQGR